MLNASPIHLGRKYSGTWRRCGHYSCQWGAGPRGLCADHDPEATPEQRAALAHEIEAERPRRTAWGRRRG